MTAPARWLRMGQACRKTGFSRPTLRRLLLEGEIIGKKHGSRGDWRILESSLDAHMDPQNVQAAALDHIRRLGL